MIKNRSLKDSNIDYPLLGYRVSPSVKESLTDLLEEVLVLYNESLAEDEKPFKKNDIFVRALKRGLTDLKRAKT